MFLPQRLSQDAVGENSIMYQMVVVYQRIERARKMGIDMTWMRVRRMIVDGLPLRRDDAGSDGGNAWLAAEVCCCPALCLAAWASISAW